MLTLDANIEPKKATFAGIIKAILEYRFYGYYFAVPLVLLFGDFTVCAIAAYTIIADIAIFKIIESLILQTMKVYQIAEDHDSAIVLANRWIESWYMSKDFKENIELIRSLLMLQKSEENKAKKSKKSR